MRGWQSARLAKCAAGKVRRWRSARRPAREEASARGRPLRRYRSRGATQNLRVRGATMRTTPAATGPTWMPTRICMRSPSSVTNEWTAAIMSRANATMSACGVGESINGSPVAATYASPIVVTCDGKRRASAPTLGLLTQPTARDPHTRASMCSRPACMARRGATTGMRAPACEHRHARMGPRGSRSGMEDAPSPRRGMG